MAQIGESTNDLTKKGPTGLKARRTVSGSRDSSTGGGHDHHRSLVADDRLYHAPGQREKSDDVYYLSESTHIYEI